MQTPALPPASRKIRNWLGLLPVLLDPRGAQAGEAMAIDGVLPGEELLHRQGVAAARFLERQETASHSSDNLRLAADHPTLGARRRQVGNRERAAIGPDQILHPRAVGVGHGYSHALTETHSRTSSGRTPGGFKFA